MESTLRSIVIHIDPNVCVQNNRDPNATKLIEIAKTFGQVEPLDSALAAERAKSQKTINGLIAQNEAIKEKQVTDDELEFLRFLRAQKQKDAKQYQAEITKRDEQLEAVRVENENRAAAIKALYGL